MNSKEFIESGILETYAMGLATEQEAKLVAEMVARYPEVKAELRAIEDSMEEFDQRNAVEPPAHLKAKILGKISDSGAVSSSSASMTSSVVGKKEAGKIRNINDSTTEAKQNNFYKYAAAVMLLLLIGSGVYILMLRDVASTYRNLATKYDAENDELTRELLASTDSVARLSEDMALLKQPSMKVIELKGMEVAPDAKAMAYANTASGEVYLEIMNLPPAPEGMQYQFWGIVDGKPVDAGMIPLAENELAGIHPMKTIPNSQAYAISLEPKGGSAQPQGKIYVMGNS